MVSIPSRARIMKAGWKVEHAKCSRCGAKGDQIVKDTVRTINNIHGPTPHMYHNVECNLCSHGYIWHHTNDEAFTYHWNEEYTD